MTVQLASASSSSSGGVPPSGAYAATCTRCLRVDAASGSVEVDEAFLLEVPDALARKLARDLSDQIAAAQLRVSRASYSLQHGLQIIVTLHDQGASDADASLLASGTWDVSAEWLRERGMRCSSANHAGGAESGSAASAEHVVKLQPADTASGKAAALASAAVAAHAQLQRVSMWLPDECAPAAVQSGRSQRGYRSLRLAGLGAPWLPVVRDGMQQRATGASALSGSVMGLDIASGIALEESFAHGVRQETIRSTVQVANDLDFAVQVCS